MNYESKILYGLDKIHYCKDGAIKPLLGALDVEVNLEQPYQYAKRNGLNTVRINGGISGVGRLTLLGLTLEEEADLLGCEYKDGEMYVLDNFNPKPLSLLFSRDKADGGELYTVVYKCIFKNPRDAGTTTQGGMDNMTKTLEFDVLVDTSKKLTYFTLDTKLADKNKVEKFFKEIQIPGGVK